jgi:hypothetical protein
MRKLSTERAQIIKHVLDLNFIKQGGRLKSVPLYGKLKQANDGYVYLDVSNNFINGIFPLIRDEGIEKPPYFQGKYQRIGAHVSVVSSEEADMFEDIEEIGEEFSFKLGSLKSVEPERWPDMDRVWFVQIESSELKQLRRKYGLPQKLNGHEFHITVACKRKGN